MRRNESAQHVVERWAKSIGLLPDSITIDSVGEETSDILPQGSEDLMQIPVVKYSILIQARLTEQDPLILSRVALPVGGSFTTSIAKREPCSLYLRWFARPKWRLIRSRHFLNEKTMALRQIQMSYQSGELFQELFNAEAPSVQGSYKNLLLEIFQGTPFLAVRIGKPSLLAEMSCYNLVVVALRSISDGTGRVSTASASSDSEEFSVEDPVIVLLDKRDQIAAAADALARTRSLLRPRALSILKGPVYEDDFGAISLTLHGACWNSPWCVGHPTDMIDSLQSLFVHIGEDFFLDQIKTRSTALAESLKLVPRPFGDVLQTVVKILGPGGMVTRIRQANSNSQENPLGHAENGKGPKFQRGDRSTGVSLQKFYLNQMSDLNQAAMGRSATRSDTNSGGFQIPLATVLLKKHLANKIFGYLARCEGKFGINYIDPKNKKISVKIG